MDDIMDVVFSDNTISVYKIDDIRKNKKLLVIPVNNTDNGTIKLKSIRDSYFNRNGWYYITVQFTEYNDAALIYKNIISHMISITSTNNTLKYCISFQVIPIIIKHNNGKFYIVLRISMNTDIIPDVYNIISNIIHIYNKTSKETSIFMYRETKPKNIEYFQWLFVKEYIPYFKMKNKLKKEKKKESEIKYGSLSSEKIPPLPPMPLTLHLHDSYHNEFHLSKY